MVMSGSGIRRNSQNMSDIGSSASRMDNSPKAREPRLSGARLDRAQREWNCPAARIESPAEPRWLPSRLCSAHSLSLHHLKPISMRISWLLIAAGSAVGWWGLIALVM